MAKSVMIGYSKGSLYVNNRGKDYTEPLDHLDYVQDAELSFESLKSMVLNLSNQYGKRKMVVKTTIDDSYTDELEGLVGKYWKKATFQK